MDIFEAINKRYSYRGSYKNTPIPRGDLQKILEAGLAAPSGCNTQTTSLIAVDDPDLINSIAGMVKKNGFEGGNPPAGVCVLTQRILCHGSAYYNVQDYSAAIENILLAITALGYASCWIEGQITTSSETQEQMAKLLNIPEGYTVVGFLPVGIPEADGKRPPYKMFSERAWFNAFGKEA